MKIFFRYATLLFLISLLGRSVHAQTILPNVVLPAGWKTKGYVIKFKDDLNHPQFSWPLTRIRYQLDLSASAVGKDQLTVVNAASGKPVVFQLSNLIEKNGLLQSALLSILTDLPSGTDQSFRIITGKKAETANGGVLVEKTAKGILINNGLVKIQIPASGTTTLLPPIINYGNNTGWLGHGEIPSSLKLTKLTVQEIANGNLFAEYKLLYDFDGNKHYNVTIRLVKGMEFAEIEEEMTGFDLKNALSWRIVWDGINTEYRYCGGRGDHMIDAKLSMKGGYNNIKWEPMEGNTPNPAEDKHPEMEFDQKNQKDGKLPFRLAPYDNWVTWWRLPTAAFWSEKQNTTIGIFIKDTEKWNDGLYSIWGSKENLNITYHWRNNVLDYTFPLVAGTRSVSLATYPHDKDVNLVNTTGRSLVYIDYLRRWYGWLSLDKTKSWILDYEKAETNSPKYFKPENVNKDAVSRLEQSLGNELKGLSYSAERNLSPNPVGTRTYYENFVPAMDVSMGSMDRDRYTRIRAWYLFMNYVFIDESLMPMRTMLAGHPNFLSDIKGVTGLTAMMFPNHPQARESADHFEKFINLNFNYHIRPDVDAWDAKGGRWTENMSTYVWAALKPTIRTSALLRDNYDGRNRLLQPGVTMLADWILNSLSSPVIAQDNRRGFLPQGAHSNVYGNVPADMVRQLAQGLVYYNPLLAEHLLAVTTAKDQPFETRNDKGGAWKDVLNTEWAQNTGTAPHLISAKYTGYGFVLRNRFGTKDEMFVNLQQIDDGPNYRWGRAAEGGNGVIYYFAQGKRYSHNGTEDVGDGPFGDVERITNFGVKKSAAYRGIGPYRAVGRNDLTEPLYNFDLAQLATVKANANAAPDYISRSVLQSGADYIVVFDKVADKNTEGRFSWFTKVEDDFPSIIQLKPGVTGVDADIKPGKSNYHNDKGVLATKGRYYDGKGDFLTLVTHKPTIRATATNYGCDVQLENGQTDHVFRGSNPVEYKNAGVSFSGTAGIVKQYAGKKYAAALFEGTGIGFPGLNIQLSKGNKAGISLETTAAGFQGKFQATQTEVVKFVFAQTSGKSVLYLDGLPVNAITGADGSLSIKFPAGKHSWQFSNAGVIPQATQVLNTVVKSHQVTIKWQAVPGASGYVVQTSKNGGADWLTAIDNSPSAEATVTNLANDKKIHVRVIAKGAGGQSDPSDDYPVYVSDKIPHAPEGLLVSLINQDIKITWGEILGAGQYKLYRREKGNQGAAYQVIYNGTGRGFKDKKQDAKVFEYVVTAVNGNGESAKSTISDSDPNRFLNWQPIPGEGFRRDTENHENGFGEFNPFVEDTMPVLSYPKNTVQN